MLVDGVSLTREGGLLWLAIRDLQPLGGEELTTKLSARFWKLKRVGFLRPPWVRINRESRTQLLSLQALAALAGNVPADGVLLTPKTDGWLFKWARDIILAEHAYPNIDYHSAAREFFAKFCPQNV